MGVDPMNYHRHYCHGGPDDFSLDSTDRSDTRADSCRTGLCPSSQLPLLQPENLRRTVLHTFVFAVRRPLIALRKASRVKRRRESAEPFWSPVRAA